MSIDDVNRRPVIGILSQEVAHKLECIYGKGKYHSYIAASYVKFLESSGARVVPISIGKDIEYYELLMNKINGVLLPGGATYFNQKDGYADAGEHIFKIARELNDQRDYFPLWGTCLGFELMPYLWLNRQDIRGECESINLVSRLNFVDDFKRSKMFGSAQDDVIASLSKYEVTYNFHKFCFTQEIFENNRMGEEWKILSTSDDGSNPQITYISSMESTRYPFFGVQFHPERPLFEMSRKRPIPNPIETEIANKHFADFFVEKCRESKHRYPDQGEDISNYTVTNTGLQGSTYEQCYLFEH